VSAAELVDDGFGLDDIVFDLICNFVPNAVLRMFDLYISFILQINVVTHL
jgi:hypothetical protein